MKLGAEEISSPHHGCEINSVPGRRRGTFGVRRHIVGMREVIAAPGNFRPTHVRDFFSCREAENFSLENSEARDARRFFARLVERLHPETNSHVRRMRRQLLAQTFNYAETRQRVHHLSKMPDAGK